VLAPAGATLAVVAEAAATFHDLAAAHGEYLAVAEERMFLTEPPVLDALGATLAAAYQYARRSARAFLPTRCDGGRRRDRMRAPRRADAVGGGRWSSTAAGAGDAQADASSSYAAFLAAATAVVRLLVTLQERPDADHVAQLRDRIDYNGFFAARAR
jgi:hypothetical protein